LKLRVGRKKNDPDEVFPLTARKEANKKKKLSKQPNLKRKGWGAVRLFMRGRGKDDQRSGRGFFKS